MRSHRLTRHKGPCGFCVASTPADWILLVPGDTRHSLISGLSHWLFLLPGMPFLRNPHGWPLSSSKTWFQSDLPLRPTLTSHSPQCLYPLPMPCLAACPLMAREDGKLGIWFFSVPTVGDSSNRERVSKARQPKNPNKYLQQIGFCYEKQFLSDIETNLGSFLKGNLLGNELLRKVSYYDGTVFIL